MDFTLQSVLLLCSDDLSVLINHASQGVLLAYLLNLVGEVFDLSPCCIDILAQLLTPPIFLFEKRPVFLHRLILAIAFSEHFECFGSIS